ncbi:ABC transporter ATP-binding protein [Sagittula stellata]|uniref:ABC transporter ATP-binding protein n=1 Tax=Sagittula stellata TaxID=52603 RepID=UPI00321B0D3A
MIDPQTMRKGWALLAPHEKRSARVALAISVISALAAAVMVASILPFLSILSNPDRIHESRTLRWIYDTFGFSSDYNFLIAVGLASLGIIVVSNGIQVLRVYVITRFSQMRTHSISQRLLRAYLRQPYEFFIDHHSGELGTKILAETQQVVSLFFKPAAELISSALTALAIIGLLLAVNPVIALTTFGVTALVYVLTLMITQRLVRKLGGTRLKANRQRYRLANEVLGGVKDIKLLGREAIYLERYSVMSRKLAETQSAASILGQTPQYVLQALAFGGVILLCLALMDPEGLASGSTLGGLLPTLGLFALAAQRLIPELSRLYASMTQLSFGRAAIDAVHEDLVQLATDRRLKSGAAAPLGLRESLRLEAVEYRYPGAEKAGLHDMTLTINAGERIGIVGSTGAGKTTLADVILGLLYPTGGRILTDGTEIDAENRHRWYGTVGYVPQDIFLVDASISENIALGVPADKIDHDKVREAARIAQVDHFVSNYLDHGYATIIGERGVRLSGGQRQRMGIARALYHDADLIVLDEATSALDSLTEAEVMRAIDALPGDKTVIMIAHRLSTLNGCDRIIVLEQGRLCGFDTWSRLIDTNSIFQKIAKVANVA